MKNIIKIKILDFLFYIFKLNNNKKNQMYIELQIFIIISTYNILILFILIFFFSMNNLVH